MSKFIVETFYTCTFKITHKLDELNEKKLSELENRNDGEVKIIDVTLNNRKTKTTKQNENNEDSLDRIYEKNIPDISSMINEKIINSKNVSTIQTCEIYLGQIFCSILEDYFYKKK